MSKEIKECVFAVPCNRPFEVAPDKVDAFEKYVEEHKGEVKKFVKERLEKHDKGNVVLKDELPKIDNFCRKCGRKLKNNEDALQ